MSAAPSAAPWPKDPNTAVIHFASAGVNCFDIIDVMADPLLEITPEFVTLSRNGLSLDAPKSLIGSPPNPKKIGTAAALRLALVAWNMADPTIKCAFAQGRATKERLPLYQALRNRTEVCHEVPYVLSIAMRALRPDIQLFVGQAAFQLVTRAPNHAKINEFFEACLKEPLQFCLHTAAWRRAKRAFIDFSCSGKIVKAAKRATIQLDSAYIATTRRDLVLIVLGLLFSPKPLPTKHLGPSLAAITARFPWIASRTTAQMPWWTSKP